MTFVCRLLVTAPRDLAGTMYPIEMNSPLPHPVEGYLQYFPSDRCALGEEVDRWKTIWLMDACENTSIPEVAAHHSLFGAALFTDGRDLGHGWNATLGRTSPAVAADLVHMVRVHTHVKVDLDTEKVEWVNCEALAPLACMGLVLLPIWFAVLCAWVYNIWSCQEGSNLQRFMTLVPLLKVFLSGVSTLMWQHCPWQRRDSQCFVMAYMGISTMFETVNFAMLVLLCKGWVITRDAFSGTESVMLACMVSLVYVCVSAHYVDAHVMGPVLAWLHTLLGCMMVRFCVQNLAWLNSQLTYVRGHQLHALRESLQLKVFMFRMLIGVVLVHTVAKCAGLTEAAPRSVPWSITASVLDLAEFAVLASVFRSRRGVLFLGAIPDALGHRVAPLYLCSPLDPKPAKLGADGVVVIRNPGGKDTHPWRSVMVGYRAKSSQARALTVGTASVGDGTDPSVTPLTRP